MPPDYLLVPADVSSSTATVWVGTRVVPPPSGAVIEHVESGAAWPVGAWRQWSVPGDPSRSFAHQRVVLTGLDADSTYRLALRVGGAVQSTAEVATLPLTLPPVGDPPLIVMLGSCFSRRRDESGLIGRAFVQLPDGARPRLKLLVGDQVYLDSPWYRFMIAHPARALGRGFLEHYVETWGQTGDAQGFNQILRSGANYFCADDHEFWNNAPFPGTYAVNTWTSGGRDDWWRMASELFAAFQSEGSATRIDVGTFSMFVLDTRINRDNQRSNFVTPADFQRLESWVTGLTSPGMLVIGQPIFATQAGVLGRFRDWNLPDFEQYTDLCQLLLSSRQSIVVLTGDVHFGRIARAPLPSGAELVEVISSPMALVEPSVGGSWKKAPDRFPAEPIAGIDSIPVTTITEWDIFANHFVTLELNGFGGGLRVRVRAWEAEPGGVSAPQLSTDISLPRVA